jgi:DNA-binding NarL/FixJ family response regulator
MTSIRVLVADDEELVRTGLRLILTSEPDIEVVGEAADGRQAVEAARALQPDVALLDIRMPELDGIEATRLLLGNGCATRVVILTTFDLDQYVYDALQAGASGFLLKDAPAHQLVTAVRAAAAGDAVLAPSVTRRLLSDFARKAPRVDAPVESLTARELDVLRLLARGLSNAEIAAELFIGEGTVKTHVARLLTKLGVRDRLQAVVLAYRSGLAS